LKIRSLFQRAAQRNTLKQETLVEQNKPQEQQESQTGDTVLNFDAQGNLIQ
jgi:hypothetical protein